MEVWPEAASTAIMHTDEMLMALIEHVAMDSARASPEFWRGLAGRSCASAFLRGEVSGSKSHFSGMRLSWFLKPDNVGKILNDDFDDAPNGCPRAGPKATAVDVYSQNQETAEEVLALRRQRRQDKS